MEPCKGQFLVFTVSAAPNRPVGSRFLRIFLDLSMQILGYYACQYAVTDLAGRIAQFLFSGGPRLQLGVYPLLKLVVLQESVISSRRNDKAGGTGTRIL